jgi:hypothetical protein
LASSDPAERDVACWYLARREADARASIVRPVHLQAYASAWQAALDGQPSHVPLDVPGLTAERVAEAERTLVARWSRRHAAAALTAATEALEAGGEPGAIGADVARALAEAAAGGLVRSVTLSDAAGDVLAQWIDDLSATRRTIPFPWKQIQEHTGGTPLGKIVMLGGRSSEHKTTFAREWCESAAEWCEANSDGHATYWTMEDSAADIAGRAMADGIQKLTTRDLMTGTFRGHRPTLDDLNAIAGHARAFRSSPQAKRFRIIDEANPTLARVLATISAEVAQGCRFIVLDFFHLIRPDRGRMDPDNARTIATALHAAAKLHRIVIVALGQLDKVATLASSEEKRVPVAAELLYGSMLKQTAFGVLMVGLGKTKDTLDVLIEKWKAGMPNASFRLRVDPAHDRLLDP